MASFEIWDKTSSILEADGTPRTPEEVMELWPFTRILTTVLEKRGPLTVAVDALLALEEIYGIDPDLPDEEKLEQIKQARTRAQNPQYDDVEAVLMMLKGEIE